MQVLNGKDKSGRVGSKNGQIASRYANIQYFQFFNGKYHTNIEIVECESGQIAQKWSNAGRICGYRNIQLQPNEKSFLKTTNFMQCYKKWI